MLVQHAGYRGRSETDSDLDVFFFTGGTKDPTRFTAKRPHVEGMINASFFWAHIHARDAFNVAGL